MALVTKDIAAPDGAAVHARALAAAWPGPVLQVDRGGRFVAGNPAARRLAAEYPVAVARLARTVSDNAGAASTLVAGGRLDLVGMPLDDGVLMLGRDMALAANLQKALAESRARYKDLVEISSDFAWETDAAGLFSFVSPQGALGYAAEQLVGRPAGDLLLDPDDPGTPFRSDTPVEAVELWLRRADGESACVVVSARPIADAGGVRVGMRGVWRDVTEERARDDELARMRHREQLMAYVVRAIRDQVEPAAMLDAAVKAVARALSADGAAIWRGMGESWTTSAAFGDASGFPADLPAIAAAAAGPSESHDVRWFLLAEATRFGGRVNGVLGVARGAACEPWSDDERGFLADLAAQLGIALAQVAAQEELTRLADTDALTGLMNRRSFTVAVGRRLHLAARNGQACALAYIDLDNFKPINDRLGHQAGDAALRAVARELRTEARASDLVARLGGDEFALLLDNADAAGAARRADRLLALKAKLGDVSVDAAKPLGMSVGIAVHDPAHPESLDALLARADGAMYEAKRAGKGRYFVAAPGPAQEQT